MNRNDVLAPLPVLERVTPKLKAELEVWLDNLQKREKWELTAQVDLKFEPCLVKITAVNDCETIEFPIRLQTVVTPSAIAWLGPTNDAIVVGRSRICHLGDRLYTVVRNNVINLERRAS